MAGCSSRSPNADNETAAKSKLNYIALDDYSEVEVTVVWGTIAQANVGSLYDLDANGDVDAAAGTPSQLKLVKVVKTMSTLEPPTASECDYVLVGNKLYIITSSNKNDLRKGEIKFEEVKTLPEGVFPAENYFPRMLVASKKVIAVEFWAKR